MKNMGYNETYTLRKGFTMKKFLTVVIPIGIGSLTYYCINPSAFHRP